MTVAIRNYKSELSKGQDRIQLTLNGNVIEAVNGDSIAAAMVSAGERRFRESKSEQPRGLFCGMGVCGECQVMVDGVSRRACLEKARDGQVVRRHPAKHDLERSTQSINVADWQEESVDVLVVGAGPAGLAAAIAAAKRDLDVLVIDERAQAGGQYFKQPATDFGIDEDRLDDQFREGADLIRSAQAAGVRFIAGAKAWGAFDEAKLAITVGRETLLVAARRFLLASGAYERPLAVPGWTLPGVMTTGAVQTLLRAYRTVPGERILIAGNGPLNFQVARELALAGADVCAIAEAAASPIRSPLQFLRMAMADPRSSLDGLRQVVGLRRRAVPVHFRHSIIRFDGTDRLESATIGRIDADGNLVPGSEIEYPVDVACMNYGFLPQGELARALGCEFKLDADLASWKATRDTDGRTSVNRVFIAGDAAGLGGARVALAEGEIAGCAIANDLGATGAAEPQRSRRKLQRGRRFQDALWTMFRAPSPPTRFTEPDTLVCRCEDVTLRELKSAISDNCHSLAAVKKLTRAGMGRCQGRYCAMTLASVAADLGFEKADADSFFAPRPPCKPVTVREIAGSVGDTPTATALSTIDRQSNTCTE